MMKRIACGLTVLAMVPMARAGEAQAPEAAYRAVLAAQYAARQPPSPARPEEAQRIYDIYLRSIGQPAKDRSIDTGSGAGTPSR